MSGQSQSTTVENTDVEIKYEQLKHGRDRLPEFIVWVRGSGEVQYQGIKYVRVSGRRSKTISSAVVASIIAEMEQVDFLSLADGSGVPMLPGSIRRRISFKRSGRKKTVTFGSYREQTNLPGFPVLAIYELEKKILVAVNVAEWLS